MPLALNKSALKQQQDQLALYRKFLPSLDLKRQQLLSALKAARTDLENVLIELRELDSHLDELYSLLGSDTLAIRDLAHLVQIENVDIATENLAGVKVPRLRDAKMNVVSYSILTTPHWLDNYVSFLSKVALLKLRQRIQQLCVERLEVASRRVTQRVNLFEKVLIPQAKSQIKRIQIFLSDQERSAVVRSKIAKQKD